MTTSEAGRPLRERPATPAVTPDPVHPGSIPVAELGTWFSNVGQTTAPLGLGSGTGQNFPREAVAIAFNGGGDLMVFMPEAECAGQLGPTVLLWDHETGDLIEAASDFAELERLE